MLHLFDSARIDHEDNVIDGDRLDEVKENEEGERGGREDGGRRRAEGREEGR